MKFPMYYPYFLTSAAATTEADIKNQITQNRKIGFLKKIMLTPFRQYKIRFKILSPLR